jgi:hypothetical protein
MTKNFRRFRYRWDRHGLGNSIDQGCRTTFGEIFHLFLVCYSKVYVVKV